MSDEREVPKVITGWDDPDGPITHGDGLYEINGKVWRVIGPRAIEARV